MEKVFIKRLDSGDEMQVCNLEMGQLHPMSAQIATERKETEGNTKTKPLNYSLLNRCHLDSQDITYKSLP